MDDTDVKDDAPKQLGRIALKRRPVAAVNRPRDPEARHAQLVALSERYGVPALDLDQVCLKTEDLAHVPRSLAQHHLLIPVLARLDRLFVAMKDPSQSEVVQEVEFVSGKRVYGYAAPAEDIAEAIERAYLARERGDLYFVGPSCPHETLRKAGLLPENPIVERLEQVVPPAPDLSFTEDRMPPVEVRIGGDDLLAHDSGPPAMVSAYPPRLSSLPPALRGRGPDSQDEMADVLSAVEEAFDNVGDEPSVVCRLPTEPAEDPNAPNRKVILVVDDEAQSRELIEQVLSDEGYDVRTADNGRQALRMLKE